jgi:hypothetical protein
MSVVLRSYSFKRSFPFKKERSVVLFILWCFFSVHLFAQKDIPPDYCISQDEQSLFDQLNNLLEEYGKKPLQSSASLFYVARTHVEDLAKNHPDTSICNLSSWSDKGEWTACCYNPYVPNQDCMWDKPKELTRYPYRGYELVAYFEDEYTVDSVIQLWSNAKKVLDMLLTNGNFEKKKWVCMGVGMNRHYISVWFGQRADQAKKIMLCDTGSVQKTVPVINKPDEPATYFLIVGSFEEQKDAKEFLRRLKKSGFENAGIYRDNQNHRIYTDKFTDLKEAMYAKKQLPYSYRDAWVFKK